MPRVLIYPVSQQELKDKQVGGRNRSFPLYDDFQSSPARKSARVDLRGFCEEINMCRIAFEHEYPGRSVARICDEYTIKILEDSLLRLFKEGPVGGSDKVILIATDQDDEDYRPGDTILLAEIVRDLLIPHVCENLEEATPESDLITFETPMDEHEVWRQAGDAVEAAASHAANGTVLIQTSGGIPSINRALALQGMKKEFDTLRAGDKLRVVPFQVLPKRDSADELLLVDSIKGIIKSWVAPNLEHHVREGDYRSAYAILKTGAGAVVTDHATPLALELLKVGMLTVTNHYKSAKAIVSARSDFPSEISEFIVGLPDYPNEGIAYRRAVDLLALRRKVGMLLFARCERRLSRGDWEEFLIRWDYLIEYLKIRFARPADFPGVLRVLNAGPSDPGQVSRSLAVLAMNSWPRRESGWPSVMRAGDPGLLRGGLKKKRDDVVHPTNAPPTKGQLVHAYSVDVTKIGIIRELLSKNYDFSEEFLPPQLSKGKSEPKVASQLQRLVVWLTESSLGESFFDTLDRRILSTFDE